LSFARQPTTGTQHPASFAQAHARLACGFPTEVDSAIVVVGTAFTQFDLAPDSRYFFIDPISLGSTGDFAASIGASFIPTPDHNAIFSGLILTLKMTASTPITGARLIVDELAETMPAVLPSMTFSTLHRFETARVSSVQLRFPSTVIEPSIVTVESDLIRLIWDGSGLHNKVAAPAPLGAGVLVFVRESMENVGGVRVHELDLHELGRKKSGDRPRRPEGPHGRPKPKVVAADRSATLPESLSWEPWSSPKSPARSESFFQSMVRPRMSARVPVPVSPPRRVDLSEVNVKWPTVQSCPGKKPFFLLKLIQAQSFDGYWKDGDTIQLYAGAVLPATSDGLPEVEFLTAFAVAALMVRGRSDAAKWELVAQKGIDFLNSVDPNLVWADRIEQMKQKFFG
jgi:hypothetical protein